MYCWGQRKEDTTEAKGNYKADWEAKLMVSKETIDSTAVDVIVFLSPLAEWDPNYSQLENT